MGIPLLVADDESFIRQAYKDGLTHAGFDVTVAVDGADALKLITAKPPAIVLLDLIMPHMNGFEVLKTLKADPKLQNIPVIILSNLSQPTDEAEVRSLGATDFLVKSDYSLKELVEKIKSTVGAQTDTPPETAE